MKNSPNVSFFWEKFLKNFNAPFLIISTFLVTSLASNAILILARLLSIIVAVLTCWYGLALTGKEVINLEEGNFNIAPVRLAVLGGVCLIQA